MQMKAGQYTDYVTYDEFCDLVADGQKADLIDGIIHMASPDSLISNQINNFFVVLFGGFISARKIGGKVLFSRFAFRLDDHNAPEPDVAYVAANRESLLTPTRMEGAPDIAVEIVARESRQRDWIDKRHLYESAGVREYWLIDPIQRRVEFLILRDGRFQIGQLEQNRIFRSEVLAGFWLNVDWLLTGSLPDPFACLQEILATKTV